MKKIIFLALATVFFWGCYTQIGTIREDEGFQSFETKKEKNYPYYADDYDFWYYQRYVYRYYLPYPRYYLFFRYYTPGFFMGWGEWWYYDPFLWDRYWWYDWYWWDRYYSYLYFPGWYYYPWWYRAPVIIVINNPYHPVSGGRAVIYRTRNFGSTRSDGSKGSDVSFSPPTRSVPAVNSSGNVQGSSSGESLRKPSGGSERKTPQVERGSAGGSGSRNIGSSREPSTPRVVPRSGSEGQQPRSNPSPPQRGNEPRRTNRIQLSRDYETGKSMLIETPRHFVYPMQSNGVNSGQSDNITTQGRRQTGNRRQ